MENKEDLIKLSKKRKVSDKLHDWNQDDMAIAYFYSQYELDNLKIDINYLCHSIIGTTVDSLMMQSANINSYLKDGGESGLSDVKPYQISAIKLYSKFTKDELKTKIKNIISQRESDESLIAKNEQDVNTRMKKIITKRKEKQKQDELAEIFRKMGKDPNKMKKLQK